jgi:hypothetical protein
MTDPMPSPIATGHYSYHVKQALLWTVQTLAAAVLFRYTVSAAVRARVLGPVERRLDDTDTR